MKFWLFLKLLVMIFDHNYQLLGEQITHTIELPKLLGRNNWEGISLDA
jgi:hypothetical protein